MSSSRAGSRSDEPDITQAQVDVLDAVLVEIHNTWPTYTLAAVAAEARSRHPDILARLSDVDLCGAVQKLWDAQIKRLTERAAAEGTTITLANMRRTKVPPH